VSQSPEEQLENARRQLAETQMLAERQRTDSEIRKAVASASIRLERTMRAEFATLSTLLSKGMSEHTVQITNLEAGVRYLQNNDLQHLKDENTQLKDHIRRIAPEHEQLKAKIETLESEIERLRDAREAERNTALEDAKQSVSKAIDSKDSKGFWSGLFSFIIGIFKGG
jgi:uncharacterized protein YdcH (DUF465 family)